MPWRQLWTYVSMEVMRSHRPSSRLGSTWWWGRRGHPSRTPAFSEDGNVGTECPAERLPSSCGSKDLADLKCVQWA